MEESSFFLALVLILITARLLGECAAWLKIPPVMGEMLAGVILGPSLLGWVHPTEVIGLLAEFGLILLLFEVGLDADITKLVSKGKKASVVAVIGFISPFIAGFAVGYYLFDLSLLVSLFIGGTLTATSIGVTLRVLRDLRLHHSNEAQIVLGAAVLDDILGVVLLAILFEFSVRGEVGLIHAGKVFAFIIIFIAVAPVMAKLLALAIGRFEKYSRLSGIIPTMIVSLILIFAWISHSVGAPELLGGFAAGLALSRRFFLPFGIELKHKDSDFVSHIEKKMKPIIQLLTPVFFVMVGLSLNLHQVNWGSVGVWKMTVLFIILAMISKMLGALLIRESVPARWAIGLAMIPRAEVGLIFAELGRVSGVFDQNIYAAMILTIAATTILPPFMMKYFYSRHGPRLISNEER